MRKSEQSKKTGRRTALLVIDVQQGLFERTTPIYKADEVLANINGLIDRARLAGAPVIFIQHANENTLKKGTREWRFHPLIRPAKREPVIHKVEGNAFSGTNLGETLDGQEVGTVVITGLVTHGCVKSTALGALELGYRVILAEDAHSNFSQDAARLIRQWNQEFVGKGAELKKAAEVEF